MKRPEKSTARDSVPVTWHDEDFARRWPTLAAYLSDTTWDDGKKRETATLTLFVDDGCLKACLSDRATARIAFVTETTLQGLLDVLQEGLEDDSIEWRKANFKQRK